MIDPRDRYEGNRSLDLLEAYASDREHREPFIGSRIPIGGLIEHFEIWPADQLSVEGGTGDEPVGIGGLMPNTDARVPYFIVCKLFTTNGREIPVDVVVVWREVKTLAEIETMSPTASEES